MPRKKIDRSEDELIKEICQSVILQTGGIKAISGKGIRIDHSSDGIVIQANLNVEFGCKIPEVAWDTQENIKKSLEKITQQNIKKININIQGVE